MADDILEAFQIGAWKSTRELEEEITLEELYMIITKAREMEAGRQKFAAALKGIDVDEGQETEFDKIKARADAVLMGKDPDAPGGFKLGLEELLDIEAE